MKIMTKNQKGFTLIGFLMASLIFALVGIVAGGIYFYHAKLINDASETSQRDMEAQFIINHLVENIEQSAWVVVKGSNNIELHSHSSDHLREYVFDGDTLYFRGGGANKALVSGITSDQMFFGTGVGRPTSRFKEVQIKFWAKNEEDEEATGTKDRFFVQTTAAAQESWNVIYVSSTTLYAIQDGTKIFPYTTILQALNAAQQGDAIVVLPGTYEISGTMNITHDHMYFSPGANLIFKEGAVVLMDPGANLYIDGNLQFQASEASRITMGTLDPDSTYGWQMHIAGDQEYFDFSHIDFQGLGSIQVNNWRLMRQSQASDFDVNINDCTIQQGSTGGFSISGAKNALIENNTFTTKYSSLGISGNYYSPTDQAIGLYNNVFANDKTGNYYYGGGASVYAYTGGSDSKTVVEVKGNYFDTMSGGLSVGTNASYYSRDSGGAAAEITVADNSFKYGRGNALYVSQYAYYDDAANYTADVYNNEFVRDTSVPKSDYYYYNQATPISYYTYGKSDVSARIHDNTIKGGAGEATDYWYYGNSPAVSIRGYNSNPNSRILVDSNHIDNLGKGVGGISVNYSQTPTIIRDNEIIGNKLYGIIANNAKNVIIDNNIIESPYYSIYAYDNSSYYADGDLVVTNSVLKGRIYSQKGSSNDTIIENSIMLGGYAVSDEKYTIWGSSNFTIKDSILWNGAKIYSGTKSTVTNSCVQGAAENAGTKVFSEDPKLNLSYQVTSDDERFFTYSTAYTAGKTGTGIGAKLDLSKIN
ncbi:MAG: hypothetical protein PHH49_06145 [Candidatus Omnitrophica bacterium]|nr:hypothetical protein [Candidatus Omnitrophota bacterium]MDD5488521.1 hypothetical protein [Candidatus Omnitrophota bacterium]